MILAVGEKEPRIAPGAFVATSAVLIGEVTLEDGASVWYQAVLDGGQGPVWIGPRTNVQDGAVLTGTAEAPRAVGPGGAGARAWPPAARHGGRGPVRPGPRTTVWDGAVLPGPAETPGPTISGAS